MKKFILTCILCFYFIFIFFETSLKTLGDNQFLTSWFKTSDVIHWFENQTNKYKYSIEYSKYSIDIIYTFYRYENQEDAILKLTYSNNRELQQIYFEMIINGKRKSLYNKEAIKILTMLLDSEEKYKTKVKY